MSGIAGIIRFDGGPVEAVHIEQMTDAMAHRGPDGIYHHRRPSMALGYCQLCTTAEALEEAQPALSADQQRVLVMDGRIDNFEELRAELTAHGVQLRNRSDAELVLGAYDIWGRDCLAHIDGDFAFVIWDDRRQMAFCARDHNGSKPFCYHWDGRTLTFASQVSAILAMPWVKRERNSGMLAEYLANRWYSRSDTLWAGVSRLVAAHAMEVSRDGPKTVQYWQPDLGHVLPCKSDAEFAEYYRCLISKTVRNMTRSHKPVAFEVSGGLDSSSLFCLAVHLQDQSRFLAPGISGYTLNFAGWPGTDELEYVKAVADHTQKPVREVVPTAKNAAWFRNFAELSGEFPGYPNGTMSIGLREVARDDGGRVLVTGIGGDEWLGVPWKGGYYRNAVKDLDWDQLRRSLKYDWASLGAARAIWLAFRHGVVPLCPEFIKNHFRQLQGQRQEPDWLSRDLLNIFDRRRVAETYQPDIGRSHRYQLSLLGDAYSILAREAEERSVAHQNLEIRSPFMSRELIQFAFSAGDWMLYRGDLHRWLHRRALRGIVPDLVLERTWKSEFIGVIRQQLSTISTELTDEIAPRRSDWVKPGVINRLSEREQDGEDEGWEGWILWTLFGCDALFAPGNKSDNKVLP
ncbi:MAG: hypothetical protein HKN11_19545 [Rhizobiales bacterium]|nr:hypothetical protein [Hyphomicrobiales bacterium]